MFQQADTATRKDSRSPDDSGGPLGTGAVVSGWPKTSLSASAMASSVELEVVGSSTGSGVGSGSGFGSGVGAGEKIVYDARGSYSYDDQDLAAAADACAQYGDGASRTVVAVAPAALPVGGGFVGGGGGQGG